MKWLGGMTKHLALCSHTSPFSHDRHCSRPGHTNPPTTILLAAARPADIPTAALAQERASVCPLRIHWAQAMNPWGMLNGETQRVSRSWARVHMQYGLQEKRREAAYRRGSRTLPSSEH